MANMSRRFNCAVIDEIQMIGSPDRGWAWTRALLGLMADEIHVCGDPSVVKLLQDLAELTDDTLEVREYKRLSPLTVKSNSLDGSIGNLRKGDCVIAFSRRDIYRLKATIERQTGKKCCVVYGSLSPEVRRQQAALFNDAAAGYDILVASDAVGMGLNLNIKRIVFSAVEKFDGKQHRILTPMEFRQIGGRAGRYGSIFANGEVTVFDSDDVHHLEWGMHQPISPLMRAGLQPSFQHFDMFSRCFDEDTLFPNCWKLLQRTQKWIEIISFAKRKM
jgi:ATP-dependent RNA helicase SUPV3L1/SUV3